MAEETKKEKPEELDMKKYLSKIIDFYKETNGGAEPSYEDVIELAETMRAQVGEMHKTKEMLDTHKNDDANEVNGTGQVAGVEPGDDADDAAIAEKSQSLIDAAMGGADQIPGDEGLEITDRNMPKCMECTILCDPQTGENLYLYSPIDDYFVRLSDSAKFPSTELEDRQYDVLEALDSREITSSEEDIGSAIVADVLDDQAVAFFKKFSDVDGMPIWTPHLDEIYREISQFRQQQLEEIRAEAAGQAPDEDETVKKTRNMSKSFDFFQKLTSGEPDSLFDEGEIEVSAVVAGDDIDELEDSLEAGLPDQDAILGDAREELEILRQRNLSCIDDSLDRIQEKFADLRARIDDTEKEIVSDIKDLRKKMAQAAIKE